MSFYPWNPADLIDMTGQLKYCLDIWIASTSDMNQSLYTLCPNSIFVSIEDWAKLGATCTQEAAVMKIPIPMAIFFFQKVVCDTLKIVPN